jgi:hypothetical protein
MKQHEIPQAGRGAVEQYPDARTLQQLSLARSQLICAFPDAAALLRKHNKGGFGRQVVDNFLQFSQVLSDRTKSFPHESGIDLKHLPTRALLLQAHGQRVAGPAREPWAIVDNVQLPGHRH